MEPPHHRNLTGVLILRLFNFIFLVLDILVYAYVIRYTKEVGDIPSERQTWLTPASYTAAIQGMFIIHDIQRPLDL